MNNRLAREEYLTIRQREAQNKTFYYKGNGDALPPYLICFSVNNNCFMRCKMCDIGISNAMRDKGTRTDELNSEGHFSVRYSGNKEYMEFPQQRLKEIIDEVSVFKPIIKVNFIEPLIYKGLSEIVHYTKEKGLTFYTITNGWHLKKSAEWLAESCVDLIRVSLDGTESVHDSLRGIPGSYERTLNGLQELIEIKNRKGLKKPIIGLCYTISNHNYFNLINFMDELRKLHILKYIYVNFNHLFYTTDWEVAQTKKESPLFKDLTKSSTQNIKFDEIDLDVLSSQIKRLQNKYDNKDYHYFFSPNLKLEDLKTYYNPNAVMFHGTPCYLPWYLAQVNITGDIGVYGHCILPPFGNIMNESFMDVWNSKKAVDIRKQLKERGSYTGCNKCIGTLYPLRGRE